MFVSTVAMARGRFAYDRLEPFSKLWRPMGIVPFNPMENQPCHAKSSSLSQLRPRLPFLPLPQAGPMPTWFGGGGFGGGHGGGFGRMGGGGFGHFGHSSFYRPGRWGHWNHWSHWNHWRHWGY